jgi:low temperature requirement protein LtrA
MHLGDHALMSTTPALWRSPMRPRDRDEHDRASTPLELFVDLCFVVGVGQAGSSLHHAMAQGHYAHAVLGYVSVFFAVWWAWMNFTWFASAYDNDDVPYRLATFLQITGVLILAAGIPRVFDGDRGVGVLGYVVMRTALAAQWVRAGRGDVACRSTCYRYAAGISTVQVGWVFVLVVPVGLRGALLGVLVVVELAVPLWAERAGMTSWHPGHIAERYGLFSLIVLGEVVLASTVALQAAVDGHAVDLLGIVIGAPLTVFAMWWVYFSKSDADRLSTGNDLAFVWGYGHYLVFGSAAAVGAGVALQVDQALHQGQVSERAAAASVTIPVAVYLLSVWWLHLRAHHADRTHYLIFPGTTVLVLLATFGPQPLLVTGLALTVLLVASYATARLKA